MTGRLLVVDNGIPPALEELGREIDVATCYEQMFYQAVLSGEVYDGVVVRPSVIRKDSYFVKKGMTAVREMKDLRVFVYGEASDMQGLGLEQGLHYDTKVSSTTPLFAVKLALDALAELRDRNHG